jgi:hypothetical protein
VLDGEGERRDVVSCVQHVVGDVPEAGLAGALDDVAELGSGGIAVGLLKDRTDEVATIDHDAPWSPKLAVK